MVVEAQRLPVDGLGTVSMLARDLPSRVRTAAETAKAHAAVVDAEARFPHEAFAEIKQQRLLGVLVPQSLGGEGADIGQLLDLCYALGQACSSSALIFAMHQIKVACLVRHAHGNPGIERVLRRVAADQWLLASSTTEGKAGGNVRSSEAAIVADGADITLERSATVISYGLEADGIVTTARRAADAASSDQVLVVLLKADYTLEKLNTWDALGMRGTHSEGFKLRARAAANQVLNDPYEKIHRETMVPYAHLAWGSVWAGIAAAATAKAQAFIRQALRQSGGQLPPGASHYTQAVASLQTLRATLFGARVRYEAALTDATALASLEFQSMITLTKVQASESAVATVLSALRACGLSGYRNDGAFSIARHLRDVLSAPLMISNDRILSNLATTALLTPLPTSIGL